MSDTNGIIVVAPAGGSAPGCHRIVLSAATTLTFETVLRCDSSRDTAIIQVNLSPQIRTPPGSHARRGVL
jgi:hypothetical protein